MMTFASAKLSSLASEVDLELSAYDAHFRHHSKKDPRIDKQTAQNISITCWNSTWIWIQSGSQSPISTSMSRRFLQRRYDWGCNFRLFMAINYGNKLHKLGYNPYNYSYITRLWIAACAPSTLSNMLFFAVKHVVFLLFLKKSSFCLQKVGTRSPTQPSFT